MFCSHCGKSNLTDANYCHKCGSKINGNKVNNTSGETSSDSSERANTSSSTSCATGDTSTSPPITFAQFRARKEDDRNKHFKKKDGKRIKLNSKPAEPSDVKINIGIMVLKDEALVVKRGVTLPLTVPATVTYEDLLAKAVEKHHRFNKGIIKHDRKSSYYILYGDKSRATYLPGCNEPFTLKRYKEEIDKPYTRMTLYLCLSSDHFTSIWNDFDHDYDTEGSCSDTNEEIADTFSEVQPINPEERRKNKGTKPQSSLLLVDKSEQPTLAIEPQQHLTAVDSQCPICFARFPIHEIEEHADNCSLWLMESEEPAELIESGRSDVEELNDPEPDVSQHKTFLKEQILKCNESLSTELKRVTVQRRFIWEDFKSARKSKIQPLSNLKVVFAGEPCIDDGGPKREMFSGKE